jgi:23S rRNA (uracil1939-C5)-methyltransferase
VAYGETVSIDEPSADRRETRTDPRCGGCLYAHISYDRQLAIKAQIIGDALGRIGKITWPDAIPVSASPEDGYRMRARLHLRGGRIGFFKEGTHDLCDSRLTGQLLTSTAAVLDRVAETFGQSMVAAEIELSENVDASGRALHFQPAAGSAPLLLDDLAHVGGLTGITLGRAGDPVSGVHRLIGGDPSVTDAIVLGRTTISLRRHVLAFFQGNRYLLTELLTRVVEAIDPGSTVIDLYAGVGVFSIAAAAVRDARVTAVEGDRVSAADLAVNAIPLGGAVVPVHQSVEEFVARSRPAPDVLLIDPPRTGMSKAALDGALGLRARTVLYVSCDVATFARDARRFLDAGYQLISLRGFDLFPNTPHVESVGVFRRS